MDTSIRLPDRALRYVLFQRTAHLVLPRTLPFRALKRVSPWPLMHAAVALESALRKGRIRRLFNDDMRREYEALRPGLPQRCSRILDIGCGVGGIDVLLHRHYAADKPTLLLLDKSQVEASVYYGFEPEGAFYNSLDATGEMLLDNGVTAEAFELLCATEDHRIEAAGPVDLAVSLLSWGFHYPVSTYLDRVYELLSPGGHLILDLRTGTEGEAAIAGRFNTVRRLQTTEKYTRVVAVK